MWRLLTKALHALPPEKSHTLAMKALRFVPELYSPDSIGNGCQAMGLHFPNRVGLAAGFDKNGDYVNELAKLGFGFIEIGTITPRPQGGSPTPRLFRLPQAEAIINRMGFNSLGVDHAARNLARQGGNFSGVLGCNIGCNKDTVQRDASKDYLHCLRELYGLADYFVVNISSPNTPGLRDIQRPMLLHALLESLANLREQLSSQHKEKTPLLVKVDPDKSAEQIHAMAEIIIAAGFNGVVATNTTLRKPRSVAALPYGGQPGGLSGRPLRASADETLAAWRKHLPDSIALIGVGGVFSKDDAADKFRAGADLVQLYTGLIYRGPQLVAECANASRYTQKAPEKES